MSDPYQPFQNALRAMIGMPRELEEDLDDGECCIDCGVLTFKRLNKGRCDWCDERDNSLRIANLIAQGKKWNQEKGVWE